MTKKELDAQAKMLAKSQQKFVSTIYMMVESIEAFQSYVHSFQDAMAAQRATMDSQQEEFKAVNETFQAAMKVFSEGFTNVAENTQKLDKFIARMEAYFGSGTGLEYEN
jgi:septal ring factor EnvC (AmiA/AmiB activator)